MARAGEDPTDLSSEVDSADRGPLFKHALQKIEEILDPAHLALVSSLSAIADEYYTQGKLLEAEPLYWLILALQDRALGYWHQDVAITLCNLGAVYESRNQYAESESFYQPALSIMEKVLGTDHPNVAIILQNLASCTLAQHKFAEAEQFYARTLRFWEKALGPDHPWLATRLERYAELLRQLGRETQARAVEERLSRIRPNSRLNSQS